MTAFVKRHHSRPAGFVPIPYRDTWTVETTFGSSSSPLGQRSEIEPAPPPPLEDDPDPGPKNEPVPTEPEWVNGPPAGWDELGGEGGEA